MTFGQNLKYEKLKTYLQFKEFLWGTFSFKWPIDNSQRLLHDRQQSGQVKYWSGNKIGFPSPISPENFLFNTWIENSIITNRKLPFKT